MQKIKSVTTYKLNDPDDSIETGFVNSIIEYDQNGNVTKSVTYLSENEIESKTLAKFNDKGELLEEINYMSEDEIAEKLTYKRNDEGKIDEVRVEYIDGSLSIKKYEYADNEIIANVIDDENEFEGKEIRKLDDKGKIIEKIIYDEDNKLDEKEIVCYDEKSNVINRKEYNKDNELEVEINYTYDENENLIKFLKTNSKNEIIDSVVFVYDEKGNLTEQKVGDYYYSKFEINAEEKTKTEERFDMSGTLQFILTSKFDENDLIIEEISPLNTIKYKYEFH